MQSDYDKKKIHHYTVPSAICFRSSIETQLGSQEITFVSSSSMEDQHYQQHTLHWAALTA